MSKWQTQSQTHRKQILFSRNIYFFEKYSREKYCFFNITENKYKVTYCLTFSTRGWLRFFHSSTVRLLYRLWGLAHQKSVCASRTIMLSWNQATGSFSSAIRKLMPACQRPKSPTASWRASDVDPRYTIVLWPVAGKRKDRNFLMWGFTHIHSGATRSSIALMQSCIILWLRFCTRFRDVTNIEVIFPRFESWIIQLTVLLNFLRKDLSGTLRKQTQLTVSYLHVNNYVFDSFKKSEACNSFK